VCGAVVDEGFAVYDLFWLIYFVFFIPSDAGRRTTVVTIPTHVCCEVGPPISSCKPWHRKRSLRKTDGRRADDFTHVFHIHSKVDNAIPKINRPRDCDYVKTSPAVNRGVRLGSVSSTQSARVRCSRRFAVRTRRMCARVLNVRSTNAIASPGRAVVDVDAYVCFFTPTKTLQTRRIIIGITRARFGFRVEYGCSWST